MPSVSDESAHVCDCFIGWAESILSIRGGRLGGGVMCDLCLALPHLQLIKVSLQHVVPLLLTLTLLTGQQSGAKNIRIQYAECRMQNAECRMQNAKCRMQ